MINRYVDENCLNEDEAWNCRDLVGVAGKQLTLASALKNMLGGFWDLMILEIIYDDHKGPAAVHTLPPKLTNLSVVITNNYDILVEDTYTNGNSRAPKVLTLSDGVDIYAEYSTLCWCITQ